MADADDKPFDSGWTPAFDWGLERDRPLNAEVSKEDPNAPWTGAPLTSHIEKYRFVDARLNSLVRRFGRRVDGGAGDNPYEAGASILTVVFRGSKGQPPSQYSYFFNDHLQGFTIFDLLSQTNHPYAEVLRPMVILAGIPYERDTAL